MKAKTMILTLALTLAVGATLVSCDSGGDDPMDNGADITAFTFNGIEGTAVIDKDALTVTATADETVDLTSIVATFTLSGGATTEVDGIPQVSKQTSNDFTGTVTYVVKSGDNRLTNLWKVTITGGISEEYRFFGVEKGTVSYSYTVWNEYETLTEQTHTLVFDNYGERIRIVETLDDGNDYSVLILDEMTDKAYVYRSDDYPNYEEYPIANFSRFDLMYHCWPANSIQWGDEREDLRILADETIAEKECSVFSFTEDGDEYEYAEWNRITFRMYEKWGGQEYELKAVTFSPSAPENSFFPWEIEDE